MEVEVHGTLQVIVRGSFLFFRQMKVIVLDRFELVVLSALKGM